MEQFMLMGKEKLEEAITTWLLNKRKAFLIIVRIVAYLQGPQKRANAAIMNTDGLKQLTLQQSLKVFHQVYMFDLVSQNRPHLLRRPRFIPFRLE
jgi:hypothetical protein